jgi:two-component system response regulator
MKSKVILLVEDNINDEELTRHALDRSGIANEIVVARDGVEAIDYLFCTGRFVGRDISQLPALVLLDLKLPKVDGLEVLRRVRADPRFTTLPIVAMTSSTEQEDLLRSYAAGVNSCVRKPVDFDQFTRAVREIGLFWLLVNEVPASR